MGFPWCLEKNCDYTDGSCPEVSVCVTSAGVEALISRPIQAKYDRASDLVCSRSPACASISQNTIGSGAKGGELPAGGLVAVQGVSADYVK